MRSRFRIPVVLAAGFVAPDSRSGHRDHDDDDDDE